MGAYEHFAYTNYQDVNIDWVLETTKRMDEIANDLDKQITDTVDAKLQEMIDDGTMSDIINDQLLSDINNTVDGLQNDLGSIMPLDATPTDSSTKGVTSNGVYDALDDLNTAIQGDIGTVDAKIDAITPLDATPTYNSTKGITSGAVYDALAAFNPNDLSTKKMLLIGDSYNNGNGGITGRGWGYYVQQFTGATCDVVHQNGGGFAVNGNANASYPGVKYDGVIAALSASADYDIIIAQGGWNDASDGMNPGGAADVASGVSDFVTAAKAKYPDAQIICLACYNDTYPSAAGQVRLLSIPRTASSLGVKTCTDSYLWMQNSGLNSADNIHLTDTGYQLLAHYIVAFLSGWDGGVVFRKDITSKCTFDTITGVSVGNNFKVMVTKELCIIDGTISLTSSADLSSWQTLIEGIPMPKPSYGYGGTCVQWSASYTRPLIYEAAVDNPYFNIRYGTTGNYRVNFVYVINLETD